MAFVTLYFYSLYLSLVVRIILGIFAEYLLNVWGIQRTFREHFKGKYFLNVSIETLNRKVFFVLKVYDLTITNIDLLAPVTTKQCFQNSRSIHEFMFIVRA